MTVENRGPAFVAALEQAIDGAYRAGADRIVETARANAPVLKTDSRFRTVGALRAAIAVEADEVKDGKVHVAVGIDEKQAFYGRFQDRGYTAVGGGRRGSGGRFIPGSRFMEHAFDTHRDSIATDVVKRVQAEIDKVNA